MYLALASLFVIALSYGVEVPQLPALVGAEHATPGLLSLLFVAYSATKITLQIPAGIWIDRSSPERALRFGLALNATCVGIFIATKEPALLVVARVCGGAAAALTFPAAFAAVASDSTVALGKRMGMVGAIAAFGMLAGFGLAGSMADRFGPRSPLIVVATTSLVLLAVLTLFRRAVPKAPSAEVPRNLRSELRDIWAYLRLPAFVSLALPVAFNKLSFTGYQSTLPVLGPAEFALATTGVASLFAATGVLFGLSQGVSGALVDRLSSAFAPALAGVALIAAMVGSALSASLFGFTAAFCAYIICSSFVFAWALRTLASRSSDKRYASNFGVFATVTDLMTIVGPPLALGLYAGVGRAAFAIIAAIAVPVYGVFSLLERRISRAALSIDGPTQPSLPEA